MFFALRGSPKDLPDGPLKGESIALIETRQLLADLEAKIQDLMVRL